MIALITSILSYIGKDVCNHLYGTTFKARVQDVTMQNAIAFATAFLITLPFSLSAEISPNLLLYGIVFGACYAATNVVLVTALCVGPAGPVTMISALGLIGGILYGVIAYGERLQLLNIAGIVVLLISVMLLSPSEKKKKDAHTNWYLIAILASVLNGLLTCIKKAYTYDHGSTNLLPFMCVGFVTASLLLWGVCLGFKLTKRQFLSPKQRTLPFALYTSLPGFFVALSTATQMIALTTLPTFIVYAFTPAGINVVMCFLSVFVFKELKFNMKISAALILFVLGTIILFV